jgi:hypothetical protein
MNIHPFIKEYLLLALRINKISDGYVDAYYGPPELKTLVENESVKSAKELIKVCKVLQKDLLEKINDSTRQKYIGTMLNAMEVFLRVLNNEQIEFNEQVEAILGVKPKTYENDSEFYTLQKEFTQVYSGKGTLAKRMEMYKERRRIPVSEIIVNFKRALEITRERTKEVFPELLPESESFKVQLAMEKVNWAFYDRYLGNYNSIIEVNPLQPIYWTTFLNIAAHEGYPGHHTEFSVKNKLLCNQLNWNEHRIILMNTPAGTVTEGIAETASYVLYKAEEKVRIELEEFCPDPDKEDSIDILIKQSEIKYEVSKFMVHLANLANIEVWDKEELFNYGMEFGFIPKENLQNIISFMLDPKSRIVFYTYNYGRDLITNKYGFPPKVDKFRLLLSKPTIASDLI